MSKSRMGTYLTCGYSYKLRYVEKMVAGTNFMMERGKRVHDFACSFYDLVFINKDGVFVTSFFDKRHFKNEYHNNFIEFQKNRWEQLKEEFGIDEAKKYFFPRFREEKIISHKLKMLGIPDAIHKSPTTSGFAAWEYKTGKPTSDKVKKYETDNYWYKILLEDMYNKETVDTGVIYFPYNNYLHEYSMREKEADVLYKEIEIVREKILADDFPPNTKECANCLVRSFCEYDILRFV